MDSWIVHPWIYHPTLKFRTGSVLMYLAPKCLDTNIDWSFYTKLGFWVITRVVIFLKVLPVFGILYHVTILMTYIYSFSISPTSSWYRLLSCFEYLTLCPWHTSVYTGHKIRSVGPLIWFGQVLDGWVRKVFRWRWVIQQKLDVIRFLQFGWNNHGPRIKQIFGVAGKFMFSIVGHCTFFIE